MSKDMKNAGKDLSAIGKTMTMGITAPIVAAGAAAFKLASDMNESLNKVDVAFGKNAKEVTDWSSTTLKKFGIAKGTALDMAALFGDMSTSMGLSTGEASNMSKSLVGLAGDLASYKNVSLDMANNALKGIYTGEGEALKNLGVVMTQANLNAYALANGMDKTVQQMTQAEQVQLRYNYVLANTSNANGDAERTGMLAAGQMRKFGETMKEMGATFGAIIMPAITAMIAKINEMVQKFGSLDEGTKKNIITALLLAAAIGPVTMVLGALATGIGGALLMWSKFSMALTAGKTIMSALGVAMGPAGLIMVGILAVAAAAFLIIKNWDSITAFFGNLKAVLSGVFNGVKNNILGIWDGIVGGIKGSINKIISAMNGMIRGMNKLKFNFPSWIPGIGGKSFGINIPQIPALADGGIVDRPTLALLGEAGPEKITPLDKSNSGINITITGNTISNSLDINTIGEQLVAQLRRKGVVSA